MTQERGKRPLNRLQSMYPLRALVDQTYISSLEAQSKGKPVVWSMLDNGYGSPFFNAMDIESVYPENYGTMCAAEGVAQVYLERAEAEGFPTHLCGYARNCVGYTARMVELGKIPPEAPAGGMPKPILLLSSGYLCDARFKWFQSLGRYLDAPVWTIELPNSGQRESLMPGAYEHEVQFLIQELREFAAFLEKLLGKKMDWDNLDRDINDTMAMDKIWYEVNELRKARPCPMHSRDFWSSMLPSIFRSADPKAAAELYRKMYDEVKQRVSEHVAGINREERYRLTFVGLPPWHSLGFFDQLAERGWDFVTEVAYHPPRPIDLSRVSDPVERLVRYRHQSLAHIIDYEFGIEEGAGIKDEIMRSGFSHKLDTKHVKDFQCDGAFLHPLLTCRATTAPQRVFEVQAMEEWKVPSLVIEGDIVDTKLFDPVSAMQKAEVFEGTMDHYRQVRKKMGLAW
jgi:benzoyl-CoA reductase/2-hydroxyglutaryl-CoA dehydratase subunit BcrC/BadD/HgdB